MKTVNKGNPPSASASGLGGRVDQNEESKMEIRCVVAALNAGGEPDFYFVKVRCSESQFENGAHYFAAREKAAEENHEPCLAYDEHDHAGKALLRLFAWDTAPVVKIGGDGHPVPAS